MSRITYRRAGWTQPRSKYFGSRTAAVEYAEKVQRTVGRKPITELRVDITACIYCIPLEEWESRPKQRKPTRGSFGPTTGQTAPVGVDLSELGWEDHEDEGDW